MDRHARERQQRYLQKRKAAGFHRLEAWIPPDLVAEIDRRHGPYGDFCRPQLAVIALLRRALKPGAALSVSGRAEVSAWADKSGEPKAGLSLVVEELATLKPKPKPRDEDHQQQPRRSPRQPAPAGSDFDDFEEWRP